MDLEPGTNPGEKSATANVAAQTQSDPTTAASHLPRQWICEAHHLPTFWINDPSARDTAKSAGVTEINELEKTLQLDPNYPDIKPTLAALMASVSPYIPSALWAQATQSAYNCIAAKEDATARDAVAEAQISPDREQPTQADSAKPVEDQPHPLRREYRALATHISPIWLDRETDRQLTELANAGLARLERHTWMTDPDYRRKRLIMDALMLHTLPYIPVALWVEVSAKAWNNITLMLAQQQEKTDG